MLKLRFARAKRLRLPGAAAIGAAALVLAGCSFGSASGSSNSASGSSLEAIQKRGVINIGVGLQTPPFGMTDAKGAPEGFDVDVAKQLADYLGVKLNAQDVSADARVPSLQSGKFDVISYTFTITPQRQQQIDFTDPVMRSYGMLAVPKNSKATSVKDLCDKRIAVQKGSIGANYALQACPAAKLAQYDVQSQAFLAVAQGQADGIVDTAGPLTYEVSQHKDAMKLIPGKVGGNTQSFALGLQKGNSTLQAKINEFLKEFHSKSEGKKLYTKWFGVSPTFDFEGLEQ